MNSIESILKISMEHVRGLVDANTVIGTPFETSDGSMIIPVSKVGMGLLSGGADIPTKTPVKANAEGIAEYPFGGTCAVGMGLTPVSFLVCKNGEVRVLPVEYNSALDRLIDLVLPALDKLVKNTGCKCE